MGSGEAPTGDCFRPFTAAAPAAPAAPAAAPLARGAGLTGEAAHIPPAARAA